MLIKKNGARKALAESVVSGVGVSPATDEITIFVGDYRVTLKDYELIELFTKAVKIVDDEMSDAFSGSLLKGLRIEKAKPN